VDAVLRPLVDVLNVVGVLGLELIEFVQAILHRIELPVDPLFAGEGIHFPQNPSLDCMGRGALPVPVCSVVWGCAWALVEAPV